MLYGGPLGTYLSGLSSNSVNSNSTAPTTNPTYSGSSYNVTSTSGLNSTNYSGLGLRRNNSRYRSTTASNITTSNLLSPSSSPSPSASSTTSNSATTNNSYSSYYTPPVRRKYGNSENETPKSSRYVARTPSSASTYTSSSSNYAGIPQYPRKSPNRIASSTTYTSTNMGPSSSWNSDLNTASYKSIDYKKLYEEEKLASEKLSQEIASAQKELKQLETQLEQLTNGRRANNVEQRKMERRISECEQELKLIAQLREESEKLNAQHRALIRVVSRLNREQNN